MTQPTTLLVYAGAFGWFMGIGSVFDGTVWANLYGRKHQGAIRGFIATALVAGTSIGPITFGIAFDSLGSYNAILRSGVVVAGTLGVLSLAAPQPRRKR